MDVKISKHIPILFHAACLKETVDVGMDSIYCWCALGQNTECPWSPFIHSWHIILSMASLVATILHVKF